MKSKNRVIFHTEFGNKSCFSVPMKDNWTAIRRFTIYSGTDSSYCFRSCKM